MRHGLTLLHRFLCVAATASFFPLAAQAPARIAVESYSLPNGLKVELVEDHSSQVVAVDLWYNVGARNERPGRTGFAHLFEHMMFQGSEHVQKAEYFRYVERAGGQLNGSTQGDRTNYYEVLPSNRLNLALWLESDRMRSLAVTQANLDNQREAVKEERRLRVDNQAYVGALVDSVTQMYDHATCFAYAHSITGSMDDLNAAKVEDVQGFFHQYYAPNNATLAIVGDFQTADAKELVARSFGDIPRVADPPAVVCNQPFDRGEKIVRVADHNATIPAVLAFYSIPPVANADYPALSLLSTIIGGGESSRLNRSLARDAKVAAAVQAVLNPTGPTRGPGLFGVLVIANQGVPPDSIRHLLAPEVAKLASEGVTEAELTKAKNIFRATTITGRQRALNVAEALHYADTYLGNVEAINTGVVRYDRVTVADIKRVAATYLHPTNSLTLVVIPEAR